MTELPETNTENKLSDALSKTIDDEGRWKFQTLAEKLGVLKWMKWFELRLTNSDPFFGYDREEREYGQVNLFSNLFRRLRQDEDTQEETVHNIGNLAAAGLLFFIRKLDSNLEDVSSDLLYNVLDLIRKIRVGRTPDADDIRQIIRKWIQNEQLLQKEDEGQISTEMLHRSALFALSDLQKRGNEQDRDVWERWFEEEPFKLAAFSGMARCADPHPPEGWVINLLNYADRAHENGRPVMEGMALEALYVGDFEPETVNQYLWSEAQATDEPPSTWDRLRDLLADADVELQNYDTMQAIEQQRTAEPDPVSMGAQELESTWNKMK